MVSTSCVTPKTDGAGIEAARLAWQARLDGARTAEARNRLGQFATPPELASALTRLALPYLPPGPLSVLEPSVGTGSFFSAALGVLPGRVARLRGVEIDEDYAAAARASFPAAEVSTADFLSLPPKRRFDLVLANPPYVRHHHIPAEKKLLWVARSSAVAGEPVSGLSGLYVHFLLGSVAWMKPGAVGVWLVPAEWLDVGYGGALRRFLSTRVTLLELHRFDPTTPAFSDALVTSAAIVFSRRAPPPGHEARLGFGSPAEASESIVEVPVERLGQTPKWSQLRTSGGPCPERLGEIFAVKRGIATGGNRFFVLEEKKALDLPRECLRPMLPSPRWLKSSEIEADGDGAPIGVPRRFLLDCKLSPADVRAHHPSLWNYLESGRPTVGQGYLCQRRRPWYAQEQRPPAPILCTYMGRGPRPFRFLRNRSVATAPNTYLLLYPRNPMTEAELDEAWERLNALDPAELAGEGRVYGGGLHKLEPAELASAPLRR